MATARLSRRNTYFRVFLIFTAILATSSLEPCMATSPEGMPGSKSPTNKEELNKLFIEAVQTGNIPWARKFLDEGADVDAPTNRQGGTPLMRAAGGHAKIEMVELLLERGANPSSQDKNGWTPLAYALQWSSSNDIRIKEEIVNLLLKHGAKIRTKDQPHLARWEGTLERRRQVEEWYDIVPEKVKPEPLHYRFTKDAEENKLVKAVLKNDLNAAKQYLDELGYANVFYGGMTCQTLLNGTAGKGNLEMAQLLLEKGADPNKENPYSATPLRAAILNEKTEMVELLLKHGARINKAPHDGFNPLMYAIVYNKPKMVELLLKNGADIEWHMCRPLQWAVAKSPRKIIEVLLDNGANVNAVRPAVKVAYVTQRSCDNSLMIWCGNFFARRDLVQVMELLLERGADVNYVNPSNGKTPLMAAANGGPLPLLRLYLDHGADVNAKDKEGNSALSRAVFRCGCSSDMSGKMQRNYLDAVRLLIEKGAHLDIRDDKLRFAMRKMGKCADKYVEYKEMLDFLEKSDEEFRKNLKGALNQEWKSQSVGMRVGNPSSFEAH